MTRALLDVSRPFPTPDDAGTVLSAYGLRLADELTMMSLDLARYPRRTPTLP